MSAGPSTQEWLAGCEPLPARECRCDTDLPCQDPGEAARCGKCGLRLSPARARTAGALPETDFDLSADHPTAEDAEAPPTSATAGAGLRGLEPQDGRPRRTGQAPQAHARQLGPAPPPYGAAA